MNWWNASSSEDAKEQFNNQMAIESYNLLTSKNAMRQMCRAGNCLRSNSLLKQSGTEPSSLTNGVMSTSSPNRRRS